MELRSYISKFKKGKETLDNLLDSQRVHGSMHRLSYINDPPPSSSSQIKFVKAFSDSSSFKPFESHAFKAKKVSCVK